MKKPRNQLQPGISWPSLKAEWRGWWSAKGPVLLFGAKFGVLLLLFYGVLALPPVEKALYFYLEANAWTSSFLLNLLGQGTQVNEVTIRSPEFAIAIRRGCDAIEPAWLLCAAILAFPGPWRSKATGMLAGFVILQLLNLVRIVTLFGIGKSMPAFFPAAHLEIRPTVFILAAILLFIGWKGCADDT